MIIATDADAEFWRMVDELSRRRFLGGLAGAAAIAGLTACGRDDGSHPSAGRSAGGPWRWTDDRGAHLDLPRRPARVAVLTDTVGAALWAAGLHPIAATDSGQHIVSAVGMPRRGIAQVWAADGGVNLEALVAARPDLLIDAVQPDGTLQVASASRKVHDIAPVLGLSVYRPVEQIAGTADRLTTALGGRLTDGGAKAGFLAASARLQAAAAASRGVRVGFVFDIDQNTIGLMNPGTWAVLQTVRALGVRLVAVPAGVQNTYSRSISWESVPGIPADLFVWAVSDPLPTSPLWRAAPAVRAGQFWRPELASWYAYSWANFAGLLDGLARRLASARPGVGPAA